MFQNENFDIEIYSVQKHDFIDSHWSKNAFTDDLRVCADEDHEAGDDDCGKVNYAEPTMEDSFSEASLQANTGAQPFWINSYFGKTE